MKMFKKVFDFRGQAINYFNKVINSNHSFSDFHICFDCDVKKYVFVGYYK